MVIFYKSLNFTNYFFHIIYFIFRCPTTINNSISTEGDSSSNCAIPEWFIVEVQGEFNRSVHDSQNENNNSKFNSTGEDYFIGDLNFTKQVGEDIIFIQLKLGRGGTD